MTLRTTALAVLAFYFGKLLYRWWNATKRQRRRNKLYREYVKAPSNCHFDDIRKDSRLKIHEKPRQGFKEEERQRWTAFRNDLRKLEENCIEDALQKEEDRRSKTPSLGKITAADKIKIENQTKKKVHGALRSFFRPGRLWGWIPDGTLVGLWDRRRFPQEELLRGMKRSHFCHMLREIITVVAMSERSREIRLTHETEERLKAKEGKKAKKARKVEAAKNETANK
ncbi:hypothetical protein QFC19_001989 [Naganishia cerealis]|uniref:Uncharacterized protein n=1 Tax=Naganishia cerealis TaxID=610337 RepID=A0ACC2WEX0_9TREE|nr:hypothetical protein QFC19_001989 [Naganishia cerealis]